MAVGRLLRENIIPGIIVLVVGTVVGGVLLYYLTRPDVPGPPTPRPSATAHIGESPTSPSPSPTLSAPGTASSIPTPSPISTPARPASGPQPVTPDAGGHGPPAPQTPAAPTVPWPSTCPSMSGQASQLPAGHCLQASQSFQSPNGQFTLTMQTDGNLVEYSGSTASGIPPVVWASNTSGNPGAFLAMQAEGRAIVFTSDGTRALWWSSTQALPQDRYTLTLQSDAALVISAPSGLAIWSNGARPPP